MPGAGGKLQWCPRGTRVFGALLGPDSKHMQAKARKVKACERSDLKPGGLCQSPSMVKPGPGTQS